MSFDPTTIVIVAALIGAGIFLVVEFIWKKDTDIIKSVGISLAIYGAYMGCELICAALNGDPGNLPERWREYLVRYRENLRQNDQEIFNLSFRA